MRGTLAATLAGSAVVLLGLALAQGVVSAFGGAYLLVAAPLTGLLVALVVLGLLRRVCRTGSRSARQLAWTGIVLLVVGAVFGVSFGGSMLLLPVALLTVAAAITPQPPAGRALSPVA